MKKPNKPEAFFGTVHLKEWMLIPQSGQSYILFSGMIHVHENKKLTGFDASNREANWTIEVRGETESVFILGCQIKAISQHQELKQYHLNTWLVP